MGLLIIFSCITNNIQSSYATTTTTTTTTTTGTLPGFNFAAVDDTNCNSNTEDIVADIQTKAADLW